MERGAQRLRKLLTLAVALPLGHVLAGKLEGGLDVSPLLELVIAELPVSDPRGLELLLHNGAI